MTTLEVLDPVAKTQAERPMKAALIRSEIAKWGKVTTLAGIQPE